MAVRKLVREKLVSFMVLVETKHSDLNTHKIRRIWGNSDCEWRHVTTVGGSSGLICVLDKEFLEEKNFLFGRRWLCVEGRLKSWNFEGAFLVVFGAHSRSERKELWSELLNVKDMVASPLVVMGDLNEVLKPKQRRGDLLPKLTETDALLLESQPTLEEIKAAVWSCESSKAPGYNGFNFNFIKKILGHTTGRVLSHFVLEFFQKGHFPREINTKWVTLIPKCKNAVDISEFRPISMVGCFYFSLDLINSNVLIFTILSNILCLILLNESKKI